MTDRKKYDRERKQKERALNTPYAQRVRESKRSESSKKRRNELRLDPERKEKERLYAIEYRRRPEVKLKNNARYSVHFALSKGIIKRPLNCELCGCLDIPLKDGRSGFMADHYLGYEKENWLKVKFICLSCDGKQLRKDYGDNG